MKYSQTIIIAIIVSLIVGVIGGAIGALTVLSQSSQAKKSASKPSIAVAEDVALIQVVKGAQDSVVSVIGRKEVSAFDATGFGIFDEFFFSDDFEVPERDEKVERQVSGGTGFIVRTDGLILTNRHVVDDDEAKYTVVLNDGTELVAEVVDKDFLNDVAFLQVVAKDLPALTLGDSDQIQIGQTVLAIGNTLSEYSNTVTKGIVSGIDRKIRAGGASQISTLESAIQTDAAINPGNSGGPLLNLAGEVIGINTAVDRAGEGIGFAIPINEAKPLLDDVVKNGRIISPFLGVRYVLINDRIAKRENLPINYGALVISGNESEESPIIEDSPAEIAGISENDIIYEINNKAITIDNGLAEVLAEYEPKDKIKLKVKRGEADIEIEVTLGDRDDF